MFYHPQTESEILSLRRYLAQRAASKREDEIDRWIRMVAANRLTGHLIGFFSVYTLPPNQAMSAENQRRVNKSRKQKPGYGDLKELILRKTQSLLRNVSDEQKQNLALVFQELYRITSPHGVVAFEVGEIRKRNLKLDEVVVPIGLQAGFRCAGILVNQQEFTKTSDIWGIRNNQSGTNTNRIAVFQKSHLPTN